VPTASRSDRSGVWLALLTIYVIWGSTYLGIAVAIETVPPFLMAAIRFVIAGLVLLAWARYRAGAEFSPPSRRAWRDAVIAGGLLFGGGNGLVGWGEQTVPSGIAALMIALVAVWFAVFSRVFLRDRIPGIVAIGIGVGLAGVALLVWPAGGGANRFDPAGVVALIAAPMCWAGGSIFAARKAELPRQPMVASAIQMLAGGAVLAVEAVVTGELGRLHPAVSAASLAAIAYLVVFGSLVAFSAYSWLLHHAPLPLIGTYAFVNPVVAVILGAVVLAEPITPRTILAAGVIVAGVALVILGRSRLQAARRVERPRASSPETAAPGVAEPASDPA
jgi:drug/metabolite transporter (DMT)-like permease